MLAPNINALKSVKTAAAAVSQVQQNACQQKGTPEFLQDENPPLFVDASVRYTESQLDHWFLALSIAGRSACAIPVVGWFLGPALITGRMRLSFSLFASKRIQFPERRNFVCLVQSGIQEVLLANNRNRKSKPH